ncbi:MAG: hypothetical protein CMF52_03150 [Legionellales bacterium]|nr:hypothetical protein [Legionellales bacterium]|tara:strand:- start:297 stop:656 length:360 start_codon:yes stop_codon:yes gene_type:complete
MTEEGLNAAVLRLQSLAIETYGRIKDIYKREQQDGDVDTVSSLSMKLANYEGALLTLQQYKQNIIDSAKVDEEDESPEQEQEDEVPSSTITEDQLRETSESFKRSIAHKRVGVKEVDES